MIDISERDEFQHPMFSGSWTKHPEKAKELAVRLCEKKHAVALVKKWHSRLPKVQRGPWTHAFHAVYGGRTYGVALWNAPSARGIPEGRLELRRMAIPDHAPKFTATRMLGEMAKYFRKHSPEIRVLISYQDIEVHEGTIYRAANWCPEYFSAPRQRDRSGFRPGTKRLYRKDSNGVAPAAAGKIRWELDLYAPVDHSAIAKKYNEIMQLANK